ncbi:hypothetical protein SPRG_12095 [Saprolegnia parasitica CBS 223.65]|uniref:USP domain-containing protein n=1 Tax=Saprolegnia parasitica (strain CBS 223.65) TaxID=695850 RepID=A0A067C643_SAPPC|nr:hypothetical protein SPRG_12095 [Saprolegnia parasitica CBS 223.65]KDO22257.1 hypothetical protein SPRG_12095 [Saprolegnia parasitica CBS 223.65]|eukprot:XP_012206993.1 hypothetical protein SPRG_12095 [Saprolegnia parasitica CBS 223.65]
MDLDPCPDTSTSTPARDDTQTRAWNQLRPASTTTRAQSCLLETLYMTPALRTRLYQSTSAFNDSSPCRNSSSSLHGSSFESHARPSTRPLWRRALAGRQMTFCSSTTRTSPTTSSWMYSTLLSKAHPTCTLSMTSTKRSLLDTFLGLSLGVASTPTSVEEAITSFLAPERIVGNHQWLCDVCGTTRDAFKRLSLVQLPPLLTLQLKRFAWDHGNQSVPSTST